MILRLFILTLVLIALLGLAYYFSGPLLDRLEAVLSLDKDGRERLLGLMEIVLKGLAIFTAVFAAIVVVWKFIFSKKNDDFNKTVINEGVTVRGGDFVLGNKIQQGDKDAGQS